ncbi:glucosaminidase domain-containing protein [Sediminitomix flava]|uniref:Flagellum-specific peptidoglycan hydrolase FlgJ n=1 Tax=Sediminitomix flava TaxID=379075 RepID=A0A315Z9V4_SEDFL|nr:glucosaminidase domain-containing protein [Sediminitomix flava]PWJ40850.1 flagellum-specific peptidoglycan hydrolase FlgJ [Sediminitomix flava]
MEDRQTPNFSFQKISRITLVTLLLQISTIQLTTEVLASETPKPMSKQEAYIRQLYYTFEPICLKYGINTKVAISQAIMEQGWALRSDYRIFNIYASANRKASKVVWDNGEARYRRYRTYTSLDQAVEDYCKVLNSWPAYTEHGLFETKSAIKQIEAIVKGGYATNPNYEQQTKKILMKYVSPIVDLIRNEEVSGRSKKQYAAAIR